jgi:WD40 repeat protein
MSPAQSLNDFEPLKVSYAEGSNIVAVDSSMDGRLIVSGCQIGNSVTLWDRTEGERSYGYPIIIDGSSFTQLIERDPYPVTDVKFSPDGAYVLVGSYGHNYLYYGDVGSRITMYEVASSKVVRVHDVNKTIVQEVAFSPDGSAYAASYEMSENPEKCTINLWDTQTGEITGSIVSDNYKVTSITFTPDGKYLVVSFDNRINPDRIVFFDAGTGEAYKTMEESSVSDLHFSDDGTVFAAGSNHFNGVIVWDGTSYEELHRFTTFDMPPRSTSLSPDGRFLMSTDSWKLVIWDLIENKKILSSKSYDSDYVDDFRASTFSKDGNYIIIGLDAPDDSQYKRELHASNGMVFVYNFTNIVERYYD